MEDLKPIKVRTDEEDGTTEADYIASRRSCLSD